MFFDDVVVSRRSKKQTFFHLKIGLCLKDCLQKHFGFKKIKIALTRMQNVCQTSLTCLHASVNGAKADLCGAPDSHDNILEAQKLNQLINTQINATTGSSSYLVLIHKFYLSFLSLHSESDSRKVDSGVSCHFYHFQELSFHL